MTTRQIVSDEEILAALEAENGSRRLAAERLGVSTRTVQRRIRSMKSEAILTHEPTIDGDIVRQSTLTNKNGEVVAQWDIRVPEKAKQAQEALIAAVKAEIVPIPPASRATPPATR